SRLGSSRISLAQNAERQPGAAFEVERRFGWEAGTRTPILRSRAACPTIERPPSRTSGEGSGKPPPGSTLFGGGGGRGDRGFLQELHEVREVPRHPLAAHRLDEVEERRTPRGAREGHPGGVDQDPRLQAPLLGERPESRFEGALVEAREGF